MAFFKANIQEKKDRIPLFFLLGVCLIAKDLFLRLFTRSIFASSISVKKDPIRRREKFSFKKSIVGTGNFRSCQWPIGDPLEEGFHYCGGQNIPTKPYCIEHFKKAYNVDEKYLDRLLDFLHEKN